MIRANVQADSFCDSSDGASERDVSSKSISHRHNPLILLLVVSLLLIWLNCVTSIMGLRSSIHYPLMPITALARFVVSTAESSFSKCTSYSARLSLVLQVKRHDTVCKELRGKPLFIPKRHLSSTDLNASNVIKKLASHRASELTGIALSDAASSFKVDKLALVDRTSNYLLSASYIIDGIEPQDQNV